MLDNLEKYEILLASNSPRRKELLGGLDIKYRVISLPDIDESYPEDMDADSVPLYIAEKKAAAYTYAQCTTGNTLIITADTVVICDGEIMGKPVSSEDAKDMLRKLSGKTHKVITGVCVKTTSDKISFASTSLVTFSDISDEEIDYYIAKYSPYDKAGSYGIQEWIGYIAVERIDGSYFNVMGLPIQKLYNILKNMK